MDSFSINGGRQTTNLSFVPSPDATEEFNVQFALRLAF